MLPRLTPSDLAALINETLEFAYPAVEVEGEVKGLKVSRGKWVYFDIVDESAKIRCFGTVYNLPGPLEDGMLVRLVATPRLNPQYGFSLGLSSVTLSGEGNIKKGADLLKQKLEKEGVFSLERKRTVSRPPSSIGLITSSESAAYKDFVKVLSARFGGIDIRLADVQVQGVNSVGQIVGAIKWFNNQSKPVDVLVLIRGGGSIDDLQSFSDERVVRAVAGSRIPTAVAIGHETDMSLAEMASDMMGSTPSNIAEMLVPDRKDLSKILEKDMNFLNDSVTQSISNYKNSLVSNLEELHMDVEEFIEGLRNENNKTLSILESLDPRAVLKRGYAIVKSSTGFVKSSLNINAGEVIIIEMYDGNINAEVIESE